MEGRGKGGRGGSVTPEAKSSTDDDASPTRVSVSEVVLGSTQKPPRVWEDAVLCCIEEISASERGVHARDNKRRVGQRRPTSISELLPEQIRKYRNFG